MPRTWSRSRRLVSPTAALIVALVDAPGIARAGQDCANYSSPEFVEMQQFGNEADQPNACNNLPCYRASIGGPTYSGVSPFQMRVPVTAIGSHQLGIGGRVRVFWFRAGQPTVPCNPDFMGQGCANLIAICGVVGSEITKDHVDTFLSKSATCANRFTVGTTYSVSAYTCKGDASCEKRADSPGLDFSPIGLGGLLGCEPPPPAGCGRGDNSCTDCVGPGGDAGGGGQPSGGPAGVSPPGSGPGARLTYLGGGVGRPGFPGSFGSNPWRVALGRYWSADYFERIVPAPDSSHVWLLTKFGTFRELGGLAGGFYTTVAPSDEYRQLEFVSGTGWILHDLEGGVQTFDANGRWTGTTDKNGNATTPLYVGNQLASVSFPDGRSELFEYYTDPNGTSGSRFQYCNDGTTAASCVASTLPRSYLAGRLRSITEVGIGGATRTWGYDWYGDDLVRISRPDGTAWRMQYRDGRFPGFLTEVILRATNGSERVTAAFAYDSQARVLKSWKGDTVLDVDNRPAPGAAAVDVWSFAFTSFDANGLPETTDVTDPLGKVITYTFGRDTVSRKSRLEHVTGSCPACGIAPNSDFTYADPDPHNALRPSSMTDGNGNQTDFTYDGFGRTLSMIEAVGVPTKQRMTTWTYHPTFRSFPTSKTQTSTSGSGLRETDWSYDPDNGNLLSITTSGTESGSAFAFQTTYFGYNVGGRVGTIDPQQPASYGTTDQTTFTYDPARGTRGLILQKRGDPLVGADWEFGYDAFNRRNSVKDPNGHETFTVYDNLNRITEVRERFTAGSNDAVNDLVTSHTYTVFGDLDTVTLPKGNRIDYGYDGDGRLQTIERLPAGGGNGDRTTRNPLNAVGQPLNEVVERWDGTQYVKDAETSWVYASRCQVQKTIRAPGGGALEATTENEYDCNGNLAKVWDAEHPKATFPADPSQTYRYDELNRLDRVTEYWAPGAPDPVGTAVNEYGYDVQDHLASVTDANGNVTTYTTSDRDLLTQEVSPAASGTTIHTYDAHGQLETTTDARGVVVTRTHDAADRVTLVDYPTDGLNVTYSYGSGADPALFDRARLVAITRNGDTIGYRYDRFGRLTGDGLLGYGYDKNGNRSTIDYPLGVVATYTHDFADREDGLVVTGAGPQQTVASQGRYTAANQLRAVTLGNGLSETRAYDLRPFPQRILVPGRLDWTYTTDRVGNVTSIDDGLPSNLDRSFSYQAVQFFLRSATGPWMGPLSWKYDKIGNRTEQTRGVMTDAYEYVGTTSKLDAIHNGSIGGPILHDYTIDAGGYLTSVVGGGAAVAFTWDDEGRLARAHRTPGNDSASFLYDGRGFLATTTGELFSDGFEIGDTACWPARLGAAPPTAVCAPDPAAGPIYSSQALLMSRPDASSGQDLVFYLSGRPIAQARIGTGASAWTYLTTDHLGTPALATDGAGAAIWSGGFEPFGAEFTTPLAGSVGVFLRFLGQWDDDYWTGSMSGASSYYNVHRWFQLATGRYSSADPLGRAGDVHPYAYARSNPEFFDDPLGLRSRTCCTPIIGGPRLLGIPLHCFIQVQEHGVSETYGFHPNIPLAFFPLRVPGCVRPDDGFDTGRIDDPSTECGPWSDDDCPDECVREQAAGYPSGSTYGLVGSNSNTFAGNVTRACGLEAPPLAGTWHTPGWNDPVPGTIRETEVSARLTGGTEG